MAETSGVVWGGAEGGPFRWEYQVPTSYRCSGCSPKVRKLISLLITNVTCVRLDPLYVYRDTHPSEQPPSGVDQCHRFRVWGFKVP